MADFMAAARCSASFLLAPLAPPYRPPAEGVIVGGMPARPTVLALLPLLAAVGCATRYVPSERMRRIQASMDPADAANLFADSLGRRLQGAGLCRAPWRFDDPGAEVTMDGFTVQAWRAGEELGRKQEGGKTLVSYRKERYQVAGRFAAIERIDREAAGSYNITVDGIPAGNKREEFIATLIEQELEAADGEFRRRPQRFIFTRWA